MSRRNPSFLLNPTSLIETHTRAKETQSSRSKRNENRKSKRDEEGTRCLRPETRTKSRSESASGTRSSEKNERVYSHLVLDLGQRCVGGGSSLELVLNHDVEISVVDLVGSAIEGSGDDLTLGDGEGFGSVEDGLLNMSENETKGRAGKVSLEASSGRKRGSTNLPVSVLGVRSSGELDGLVAAREVDVEPRKVGVDVWGRGRRREGQLELASRGKACFEKKTHNRSGWR